MRKPRSDARLNKLSPIKREILHRWIAENLPYSQIVARLKKELGVITSESALSYYYQRWGHDLLAAKGAKETDPWASGVKITATCEVIIRPLLPDETGHKTGTSAA